jgi:hypothetical protein
MPRCCLLPCRLAVPLNSSDFSSNVSAAVDQLYVCLGEQPTTLRVRWTLQLIHSSHESHQYCAAVS